MVFCKNCKHIKKKYGLCGKTKTVKYDFYNEKHYYYRLCENKNKNNDCEDYQKKWWKLGIEEK